MFLGALSTPRLRDELRDPGGRRRGALVSYRPSMAEVVKRINGFMGAQAMLYEVRRKPERCGSLKET